MREIRLYGSEGGGAVRSPYPYQSSVGVPGLGRALGSRLRGSSRFVVKHASAWVPQAWRTTPLPPGLTIRRGDVPSAGTTNYAYGSISACSHA